MGLFGNDAKNTKYLGGSGESLTVWISIAAGTVLIFYGYDQVSTRGKEERTLYKKKRDKKEKKKKQKEIVSNMRSYYLGSLWQCSRRTELSRHRRQP